MLKVIIADDHSIVRDGIRTILQKIPDVSVVGEAGNGLSAVELVEKLSPDLVVMDLRMPVMDGIDATQRIAAAHPDLPA